MIPVDPWNAIYVAITGWFVWWIKKLSARVDETLSEKEIRQLVNAKLTELRVRQEALAKDLHRIETKIDRLLDLYLHSPDRRQE